MKKRKFIKYSLIGVLLLVFCELFLRVFLGFCDAVLIREDKDYEYIAQANQERHRFGKRIFYNEFSMRSDPVKKNAIKILGFGDSVINGGTLTDQDSLATTKLSGALSRIFDTAVQVLNISAGSWGPDNCSAYLEKNGDFDARMIFLVASSHDAYDRMNFEKIVGVNPAFPEKQYKLALAELICRYVIPRFFKQSYSSESGINKQAEGDTFNPGFEKLMRYAARKKIPFFVYLHPEKEELKKKMYNGQGEEIINFTKENHIRLVQEIDKGISASDYRDGDNIHPNEAGQEKMFRYLLAEIVSVAGENDTLKKWLQKK